MQKIPFLLLFVALTSCVVYPDGRVAGAFDEHAINSELKRTVKQNGQ
jgi:hypothetical protein